MCQGQTRSQKGPSPTEHRTHDWSSGLFPISSYQEAFCYGNVDALPNHYVLAQAVYDEARPTDSEHERGECFLRLIVFSRGEGRAEEHKYFNTSSGRGGGRVRKGCDGDEQERSQPAHSTQLGRGRLDMEICTYNVFGGQKYIHETKLRI